MNLQISRLSGKEILPHINDLAKLRISVFKEYPYLYQGSFEYELKYLSTYTASPDSVMIIVSDHGKVVGASTAIPLKFETDECQKPFLHSNININDVFYFGESVLDKNYRGQGIYRHFFLEREAAARAACCHIATFCAVERPDDDERRPKDYTPLDAIWTHFGYVKHPEIATTYEWCEIGETTQSPKPMTFWLKTI